MRGNIWILLGILAFQIGCASSSTLTGMVHDLARDPRYPDRRYMKGVGISEESMQDAIEKGKVEISHQISSRIESSLVSSTDYREVTQNAETVRESIESVREKIKIASHFKYGALLQAVPEMTREFVEKGQRYYLVLVVLDRAKFQKILEGDFQQAAEVFRIHRAEAARAFENSDIPGFTLHLDQARSCFEELVRINVEAWSVFDRAMRGYDAYRRAFVEMLQEQHIMLRKLAFCIKVRGTFLEAERQRLQRLLSTFLARHGLKLLSCPQVEGGYQLIAEGGGAFGQGYFPYYRLDLEVTVTQAHSPQEMVFHFSDDFKASARTEAQARESLFDSLLEELEETLYPEMKKFFPIL